VFLVVVLKVVPFGHVDNDTVNNEIMEMIAEIETSNHDINTLKISYEDYMKRTDAFLSKYVTSFYKQNDIIYAEDNIVFAITGKHYKEDDWKGMPLEELKKIGEPLMQSLSLYKKAYFYNSFDISKIYDDSGNSDNSLRFKHVYVHHNYNISEKNYIPYKKYIFKKEGNAYVLFSISLIIEDPKEELKFGNEKVEFIKSVNL
jgi:hypothetical protein